MGFTEELPFLAAPMALAIASLFVPIIIRLAHRYGWLSAQDFRRKENTRVPLLGGLAVYLSFAISSWVFQIESSYALIAAGLPLVLVGISDDIFELGPKFRFLTQAVSVAIWLALTPSSQLLLSQMGAHEWVSLGITAFWIIGIINALNMIDGVDALAGGFSTIACLFLGAMGGQLVSSPIILAAGILGFLLFNRPPAKIYLGESGSTFLGLSLATMGATLSPEAAGPASVLIPLFLLAFPEVDAIASIIRRKRAKSSALKADHDHIHHKLKKVGFDTKHVLAVVYGATVYSGLTAFTIFFLGSHWATWVIGILATAGLSTLLWAILYLEHRQAHQVYRFSRTLLERHLPMDRPFLFDPENFHATIYDLLPYYKELQYRGVAEVNNFIQDFSAYVLENHPHASLKAVGSYSVMVVEPLRDDHKSLIPALPEKYFDLLVRHKVKKNDDVVPWGMSFYSSQFQTAAFFKKFDIPTEKPLRQAA